VTEIGAVSQGRQARLLLRGEPLRLPGPGFEHFKRIRTRSDK
jgi:hypothetical protein